MQDENLEEISLEQLFTKGLEEDPVPREVLSALKKGSRVSKYLSITYYEDRNSKLYYKNRRYVPDYVPLYLRLADLYYNKPIIGYPGARNTYTLLRRGYFWPRI